MFFLKCLLYSIVCNDLLPTISLSFLFKNLTKHQVGSTTTIEEELKNAGDSVGPYKVGPVFFPTEKKQSIRITKSLNMDESHTLISAISMIAPR